MKFTYTAPTEMDREEILSAGLPEDTLNGRIKMTVQDDEGNEGVLFLEETRLNRLGKPYIESHTQMQWLKSLETWDVTVSENDWYNDLNRNPEQVINLQLCDYSTTDCAHIFYDADKECYYGRQQSHCEKFARWMVLGPKCCFFSHGSCPAPNTIFSYNGEVERVRHDDWNGVAAYSDTFNENFVKEGEE